MGAWRVALALAAVGLALVPLPPALIERAYSTEFYPRLQSLVTSVSNRVPFALFDALILGTLLAWLLATGVDVAGRRGWARVALKIVRRTVVWTAALYLVFLFAWGLNYRRVRLADKLQFDTRAISPDATRALAITTVSNLNALHGRAHEMGWPALDGIDGPLRSAFDRTQRDLGARTLATAGRPKLTLLDRYFRRAGVAGMTDPYFLETLVDGGLLPFERPFVVAHEWGHLAGFADEAEANFLGWLTSVRGSIPDQYSGWLFLYEELTRAVRAPDRAELASRLGPGPRADLGAIVDRWRQQVSPTVSAAGWRVYDRYLKANRVEAGAGSYAEVVRLVLGTEFGPDWTPLLR